MALKRNNEERVPMIKVGGPGDHLVQFFLRNRLRQALPATSRLSNYLIGRFWIVHRLNWEGFFRNQRIRKLNFRHGNHRDSGLFWSVLRLGFLPARVFSCATCDIQTTDLGQQQSGMGQEGCPRTVAH